MRQATAFWSLKPAAWLPRAPDGCWNRRQTAASFADRVPHVASVFNEDMRHTIADRTRVVFDLTAEDSPLRGN
jgi:hypothetical protein